MPGPGSLPLSHPSPTVTTSIFAAATGLGQFHFLRPWWLLALVPALLLVWAIHRQQDAVRPWRGVIAAHLLPHLLISGGPQHRLQPVHLLLLAWLLAILAVAGPTWRLEPAPFAEDTAALVIAVEVTPTMTGAGHPAVAPRTRGAEDPRCARQTAWHADGPGGLLPGAPTWSCP